jgi:hypothetical protein
MRFCAAKRITIPPSNHQNTLDTKGQNPIDLVIVVFTKNDKQPTATPPIA